jgi:hypothetical protein
MEKVQMIALGTWAERASLAYKPVNSVLGNGMRYGAYGVPVVTGGDTGGSRRPYRVDESDTTAYIMYDDDANGPVPIYRITEV